MNKLRLLRKLKDDGQLGRMSGEELRLFLLMIAGSTETGEGEILTSRIGSILGKNYSSERLMEICEALEKKHLVRLTYCSCHDRRRQRLAVKYCINLPG